MCICMCGSYCFPYVRRSCQACSTRKLDIGEDMRVMGDITGLLGAHFITMELVAWELKNRRMLLGSTCVYV